MKKILLYLLCPMLVFGLHENVFGAEPAKSDVNDQVGVKVTIYNNNLGLIKDMRKVTLPVGEGELRFIFNLTDLVGFSELRKLALGGLLPWPF